MDIVESFYGVYLLYCQNPRFKGRTYIGYTTDPNRRIKQHNKGRHAGGAGRTSNRGPWEMALIVHGFPNSIAALRFEWAWQNPARSRRLRHVPAKRAREVKFDYCLRVMAAMLQAGPWRRLPLTVRWLRPEYRRPLPADCLPPPHMPVVQGAVRPAKAKERTAADGERLECALCGAGVPAADALTCLSPRCPLVAHLVCLADELLRGSACLLPVEGACPACGTSLLWGDLIRKKNGCYDYLDSDGAAGESGEHWADCLSQECPDLEH
ncbi:structure-specific endonuclease subunit slx1-like [Pollicipes pollicipes]|uniref:structure-specific endonuclease subunit slx1-like n=1 Tax=Pollicipes pollicipes TaxID=41117 RepID=UPI001884D03E|nr:structure-specific endonuclease subunit slx1-like [Pollicipes pollicipes]